MLYSTHRSAGRTAWPLHKKLDPSQAMLHTQVMTKQHHKRTASRKKTTVHEYSPSRPTIAGYCCLGYIHSAEQQHQPASDTQVTTATLLCPCLQQLHIAARYHLVRMWPTLHKHATGCGKATGSACQGRPAEHHHQAAPPQTHQSQGHCCCQPWPLRRPCLQHPGPS